MSTESKLILEPTVQTVPFGDQLLTIETGAIARQADGAVMVRMGDSMVLVTVVADKKFDGTLDFLPLTVNYQERAYAGGKIPGGFLKREGRPSEHETLISRLIDRPLRPLFPDQFFHEIQVVATVKSYDPNVPTDILAMIGASAALSISGIPFSGPLGAARVGYKNGKYLLNPSYSSLCESDLDLIVAGTQDAVLMVESQAHMLSEQVMLDAVQYGHDQMQPVIEAIQSLANTVKKAPWHVLSPEKDSELLEKVTQMFGDQVGRVYAIADKSERNQAKAVVYQSALDALQIDPENPTAKNEVKSIIDGLGKAHVRQSILAGALRIDGRDHRSVRPIHIALGPLPRVHGSAVFTRGETQAMVSVTLGTTKDAQLMDNLYGPDRQTFMLHYNFPSYSVGEIGFMSSPKRREIGHGNLANKAIKPVLPDADTFPYVLRVVSEITESNGSSSMATVCGTSLALMDAGVQIAHPVAGIAMGLVKSGDKHVVLTDILGDEDFLGDMDFKVAGTRSGITALQMDIKIKGVTYGIMKEALEQAREGRMHILDVMDGYIHTSRQDLSAYAPRFLTMKIDPEKIREVIGKGGVTIRGITDTTGVTIDLDDDGVLKIASSDEQAVQAALAMIHEIIAEPEVGDVYDGKVLRIMDFGAFIKIPGSKDGFLHISEISTERVNTVRDVLEEGQTIKVKVIEIDKQKRIRVSIKAVKA